MSFRDKEIFITRPHQFVGIIKDKIFHSDSIFDMEQFLRKIINTTSAQPNAYSMVLTLSNLCLLMMTSFQKCVIPLEKKILISLWIFTAKSFKKKLILSSGVTLKKMMIPILSSNATLKMMIATSLMNMMWINGLTRGLYKPLQGARAALQPAKALKNFF